jgi:hypothetical protein
MKWKHGPEKKIFKHSERDVPGGAVSRCCHSILMRKLRKILHSAQSTVLRAPFCGQHTSYLQLQCRHGVGRSVRELVHGVAQDAAETWINNPLVRNCFVCYWLHRHETPPSSPMLKCLHSRAQTPDEFMFQYN